MLTDTDLIYTEQCEQESGFPVHGSPKSIAQFAANVTPKDLPAFIEEAVRNSYKWGFNRAEAGCKD